MFSMLQVVNLFCVPQINCLIGNGVYPRTVGLAGNLRGTADNRNGIFRLTFGKVDRA
jgi:hypothetical protein